MDALTGTNSGISAYGAFSPPAKSGTDSRAYYIDAMRIVAAAFIILLHCVNMFFNQSNYFGTRSWYVFGAVNELTRAGVPLFFMISGYLSLCGRDETVAAYYRRRLPRLVLPLLCWNAIYFAFYCITGKAELTAAGFLTGLLNNGCAYHLWYLYALAGITLLAPYIKKTVDASTHGELVVLLLVIVFPTTLRPIINLASPVYVFLFAPLVEGYAGYFLLGYLIGRFELTRAGAAAVYVSGIAGFALGYIGNCVCAASGGELFWNGGYTLNHYLVAAALFLLFKRSKPAQRIGASRTAALLSSMTFTVYLSHILFCELFIRSIPAGSMTPLVYAAVEFVFVSICSFTFAALVRAAGTMLRRLKPD